MKSSQTVRLTVEDDAEVVTMAPSCGDSLSPVGKYYSPRVFPCDGDCFGGAQPFGMPGAQTA